MPPAKPRPESHVQAEILLRWGSHPRVRLWRQNSGLLWAPGPNGTTYRVRAAVPGAADLTGIAQGPYAGVRLEIECKTLRGRQTEDQKRFEAMIRSLGGVYILAQVMADVDRVLVPLVGEPLP